MNIEEAVQENRSKTLITALIGLFILISLIVTLFVTLLNLQPYDKQITSPGNATAAY